MTYNKSFFRKTSLIIFLDVKEPELEKKRNMRYGRSSSDRGRRSIYTKKRSARSYTGRFFATSSGGVFFRTDGNIVLQDKKYFIDADDTLGAMHGDSVTVKVKEAHRSAVVISIDERAVKLVIGTVCDDERYDPPMYVEPDDSKIKFVINIEDNVSGTDIRDGDKVEIKITNYPESIYDEPSGVITKAFGGSQSVDANYKAILSEFDIRTEFPEEVLTEADRYAEMPITADGRIDLRSELIFTIDGSDAKDFDDAISFERSGSGYKLGVHIADVSEYVKGGTLLDNEAYERGTSVYFTDKVVPMLPTVLSNGVCSLNPGVDRYALSVFIELDRFGEIKEKKVSKSLINSKIRGVYSEMNQLLEGKASEAIKEKYSALSEDKTKLMVEIYEKLKQKNDIRGAIELDSDEGMIILDENGVPTDIVRRDRGLSERIIEQFMLCANEAVARLMTERGIPCIYRVHETPDRDKTVAFIQFAHNLKLNPGYVKKESITPKYFSGLLEKAKDNGIGNPVSYMLLRTMQKAKYSDNNIGHFGLANKCYCHFTSPIRRYPDLVVHRYLKAYLSGDTKTVRRDAFVANAAKKSSENELKAMSAEREIEDLYKCIYMKNHIGEEHEAIIRSVTSFGIFCTLSNTFEGLVPMNLMKNRYYYDESSLTLGCGSNVYALGDKVRVRIEEVDIPTRKITFTLADEPNIKEEPGWTRRW